MRLALTIALTITLGGCAGQSATGGGGDADGFTPDRRQVALALQRYEAASDAQARGEALAIAWHHRGALVDDTVLRWLVRDLPTPPASLRTPQALERASGLGSSPEERDEARALLSGVSVDADAPPRWTAARHLLLSAALIPSDAEQQALVTLRRVGRLAPEGGIGAAQRAQAWLMEGSLEHRAGRYKEAIAAYLKVEPTTGLWREARLGMAWAQLRAEQPQHAIKVLALLPGGLTGDPERAMVAAMAAGAMGKLEAARAVIVEARTRSWSWLDAPLDLAALSTEAMAVGEAVWLRAPKEGLAIRLRAHPTVRLAAAELAAAREAASAQGAGPELQAYVARLEAAWPEIVTPLVEGERARVRAALEALTALEAQLK